MFVWIGVNNLGWCSGSRAQPFAEFCRIDYSMSALLPATLPLSPMSGWLGVDNCITAYYLPNPRAWVPAYCRICFGKLKLPAHFIPDFLFTLYNFLPGIVPQSHIHLVTSVLSFPLPFTFPHSFIGHRHSLIPPPPLIFQTSSFFLPPVHPSRTCHVPCNKPETFQHKVTISQDSFFFSLHFMCNLSKTLHVCFVRRPPIKMELLPAILLKEWIQECMCSYTLLFLHFVDYLLL